MNTIVIVAVPTGRSTPGVRVARSVSASRVTLHSWLSPATVIEADEISRSTALRTIDGTAEVISTSISTSPAKIAWSRSGASIRR